MNSKAKKSVFCVFILAVSWFRFVWNLENHEASRIVMVRGSFLSLFFASLRLGGRKRFPTKPLRRKGVFSVSWLSFGITKHHEKSLQVVPPLFT